MLNRRNFLVSGGTIVTAGLMSKVATDNHTQIEYGDTVEGTITEDHPTDPEYTTYHTAPYTFEGSVGDEIEITLTMPNADEWIRLVSPSGESIINTGTDHIELELPESGEYIIYPQAIPENIPGDFTLEIIFEGSTITPDPAYTVETRALAASPTKAVFELKVIPEHEALGDYESGSVSSLEFSVLEEDVHITRMTELPSDDGELFSATGSLLLGSTAVATGGTIGTILGSVGVALDSIEVAQKFLEANAEMPVKSVHFTGDGPSTGTPDREYFNAEVKYLVEVESATSIDEVSEYVSGWNDVFSFGYEAKPEQPSGGTDIDTQYYSANVEGGVLDDDAFECP